MRRLSAFFAVAALMAGCSAAGVYRDTLEPRAAVDLRCSSEPLTVMALDAHRAYVQGCGEHAIYVFSDQTQTWSTSAQAHHGALKSRASFDLGCPTEQVKLTEIDLRTAGVDGCGRRATYIFNDDAVTWMMNSPPAPRDGQSP
jgi:hypothetical protein